MSIKTRPLIILDFGSQYTQLIARRVREMGVYSEVYPHDAKSLPDASGFILSGGPGSVSQDDCLQIPLAVFENARPILGICYGMQALAEQLGGRVESAREREYGAAVVKLEQSELFAGLATTRLDVWMSHGDKVIALPEGFVTICSSANTAIAGMEDSARHWYGLQFHPEVTHSTAGIQILTRFVLDICGAEANWSAQNIIDDAIATICAKVGDDRVILGLSGGVDSTVAACLLKRAIGQHLICIFVDSGLLRHNEVDEVLAQFTDVEDITVNVVHAEQQFLAALAGVTCPEQKRKIIGKLFIDIFESEAHKYPGVKWLAQGTIYPDVIESAAASNNAVVIKSHHNVGGLPERLQLGLIEPLRMLFKDEVRRLGIALGLPEHLIYRHPFPGPGLAVRILGEVRAEYITILQQADHIFMQELHSSGWYAKVSQAFAVFLPVKSVAVMGDQRHYEYVIALRAVETLDFMTATWARLPWEFLELVSNRIINEVPGVSRVVYDVSGKPPSTIEWE